MTKQLEDYPEWVETIINWEYIWVIEATLLLVIIILVIIACRLYYQLKEFGEPKKGTYDTSAEAERKRELERIKTNNPGITNTNLNSRRCNNERQP